MTTHADAIAYLKSIAREWRQEGGQLIFEIQFHATAS